MSRLTTRDVESKVLSELAQTAKKKNLVKDGNKSKTKKLKIYEMSHRDRNLLCRVLEEIHENDPEFWKRFAECMGLSGEKIQVSGRYGFFFLEIFIYDL